jgi:hypothetical protein
MIMSDTTEQGQPQDSEEQVVEHGELMEPGDMEPSGIEPSGIDQADGSGESIEQPAKVMRMGAMMRQLLEELREAELDGPSRERLRDIYETSVRELGSALSPDLRDELGRLALPFSDDETPSDAELRVAEAQLVGWLEGLVQGIQATLFAQQMAAQQQLQNMRGQLPAGAPNMVPTGPPGQPENPEARPGTYL